MRTLLSLLSLTIFVFASPASGKTTVIDDSGTLPYDSPLRVHWEQPTPRGPNRNRMVGTTTIRLRLNVAQWLRRTARIYLVLPAQQPGALGASWTTQGRLLPGRVACGSRALVYAGAITAPFLEEVMQLTLEIDGTQLRQLYQINFRFEMDEE